jgi:dolichol-phosphate mannosyltransferase
MTSRFQNRRTLVATATYNERDNVEALLARVFALDGEIEALVVDDASPDGTGAVLDEMCAREPRLHVVHRQGKLGLGSAHQLAFAYAIHHNYGRLITMDADISHDPASIPDLLAALENADMVIGSRYITGGSSDYTGYRKFISICANTLARILLRISLHEFTTSFRAFDVAMLARYRCRKLRSNGYSFFTETVFRLHSAGFRIGEVPIQFKDRYKGVSKFPTAEIFKGVAKLFRLAASRATGRNKFTPAVEVHDNCVHCGSPYLVEVYAARDEGPAAEASAYSCSSIERRRRPQVVNCLQCGLNHIPGKQVPADLEALYAEVEDPNYLDDIGARQAGFRETYRRIRGHLPAPGRLLEIGPYCGLFLREAEADGWACDGIEPSRWAAAVANESVMAEVRVGTLDEHVETFRESFDVVVTWDVLEHVRNPYEMLRNMRAVLRENGILCFSTLDIDNWFPRLLGKHWPWILEMHLHYFTEQLLRRWLDEAGYEVVEIRNYSHYASARYAWIKGANILPRFLAAPLLALAPLIPARLVVPISFGDIRLFVARAR